MRIQPSVFFLVIVLLCSCSIKEEDTADRPNIVLILADDLGWSDIGSYGGEIKTPNLDRLANNGIRLTQFYNTSKCFPSRASLLTGLYAQQVGYGKTFVNPLINGITLGEALKAGGYRTLWSGKHHGADKPTDKGFDRYFGLKDGASNHFNPGLQRAGEPIPAQKRIRTWCLDSICYQPYTPDDPNFYSTDTFTNYALDWLDEYKNEENPFFLYLAYTAPHDPLMAWPEDIAKYKGKYLVGYEEIRKKRFKKQKELGLIGPHWKLPEPSHTEWDILSEEKKKEEDLKMAVYAAMIDRMDQNIGRVIERLKRLDQFDNTLIIFLSDNGSSAENVMATAKDFSQFVNLPGDGQVGSMGRWASLGENWANVSNTPFKYYKNYSFEGGINTPAIIHWPKKISKSIINNDFRGHFIDVMPTLLEVSGSPYPIEGGGILPYAGVSLASLIDSNVQPEQRPLFWEWGDGKAVRKGQWKLVSHGDSWKLYNMERDPTETEDLASQNPDRVEELAQLFENWKIEFQ